MYGSVDIGVGSAVGMYGSTATGQRLIPGIIGSAINGYVRAMAGA
jgi:hypothetical protein